MENENKPIADSVQEPSLPAESWEVALNYSGLLGVVPSSFSSVIRSLQVDQIKNSAQLAPSTRFMIERLSKSRSMKACLFFAASTFFPDRVEEERHISERFLVNLFSPGELSVFVGLSYLFKRARKLCDPAQFTMITNRFQECADLGGYLGYAIPAIGPSIGILTGAMPYLGLAPFLFYDRRGFVDYTRHLKRTKQSLDLDYELQRWSCTSIQIASVMLQSLGLGVSLASAFSTGLTAETSQVIDSIPEANKFQLASVWIRSLEDNCAEPTITHQAEFYPNKTHLARLLSRCGDLREKGSPHCWLLRGAFDISPENTPQLFGDSGDGAKAYANSQLDLAASEIEKASQAISEVENDLKEILADEEEV